MNEILNLVAAFGAGPLAVCAALLNLTVNLTKLPMFDRVPTIKPWRPFIALLLGVAGVVVASLQQGKTSTYEIVAAVVAGFSVGGGAVVLHEAWTILVTYAKGRGWVVMLMIVFYTSTVGCAFVSKAGSGIQTCVENDPALVAQVATALSNVAEGDWLGALIALVPDPTLRKCIIKALVDATKTEKPEKLSSAKALGETPQERLTRRANLYLALTQ